MKEEKIIHILVSGNYVSDDVVSKAKKDAENKNQSVLDYLFSNEIVTKDLVGQAIAESYDISYADLNSIKPSREQVFKIPEEIARKLRVVLFDESEEKVVIATDDPIRANLTNELKNVFASRDIEIAFSLSEDIDEILVYYRDVLSKRLSEVVEDGERVAPAVITEIFDDAVIYQASDIHFEPQEKEVVIRFRVDGVLSEKGRISKELYGNILNRIKVMAHLRIDEHFATQDGSIRYISKTNKSAIDMRVSVAPILDGEKVTIRLLSQYTRELSFADLGLSVNHQQIVKKASKKPFGMILVTGPTGSGKTTTLYSILKMLNNPDVNITTIEDPVEYRILGVNQIQVNAQKNITFSKGLKSIVRQDPDIILVGEIRDKETSEIAVNAALTGHLLLSTFHANDSATSIPRLIDMGIEPFLLASTLEVVFAQRLVRKVCENCRFSESHEISALEKDFHGISRYFSDESVTLYKGKGCEICGSTGYKGRTGIFEFIDIDKEMKELIMKNPSSDQIVELARKKGMRGLFEDGIEKVKNGITTIEEVYRVAEPLE
ncbi:MAG: GspE/PulE family protein [Candidatus Moranbacteria bacterium]|nr:GspE/PulE family protein [Candidatus Moranbacteria bacterium]